MSSIHKQSSKQEKQARVQAAGGYKMSCLEQVHMLAQLAWLDHVVTIISSAGYISVACGSMLACSA